MADCASWANSVALGCVGALWGAVLVVLICSTLFLVTHHLTGVALFRSFGLSQNALILRKRPRVSQIAGFTLIEVMVVIGIVAIATAIAIPDLSQWVVNDHIENAAGEFQENLQWARAYALKTDQNVDVNLTFTQSGAQAVCGWSMTSQANGAPIAGAPAMTSFTSQYPNISCTPGMGAHFPLTITPSGNILAPSTGASRGASGVGGPVITDSYLLFDAATDTAKFTTWLVKYYGAGELRSCIMAPISPQSPTPVCAIQ